MDYVNDFDKIIREVSSVLGKPIDKGKYEIIDRGIPHHKYEPIYEGFATQR